MSWNKPSFLNKNISTNKYPCNFFNFELHLWYAFHFNTLTPWVFIVAHTYEGESLKNENLRMQLENMTQNYKKRSSQLVDLGSTQPNANFNNIGAIKAPQTGQ